MDTKIFRGSPPGLEEFPRNEPPKQRRVFQICGMGNGLHFGVHNNSYVNLRRGLVERVFYVEDSGNLKPAPRPKPGIFKAMAYLARRLGKMVGSHSSIGRAEYPLLYTGRRRTIYQDAYESLCVRPINQQDARVKTFVKAEKINFTKKPDPAPRVIQPRDPRYNLEVGRYLKKYEHHLYHGIDKLWGGPTIIKGYTVEEIGGIVERTWGEFQKPCAIGFDMSRFDQHVSVDALRFEHSVYDKAFRCPELRRLLRWQLRNKGCGYASNGKIKYSKDGCRMSGDINTAMGNCLLACCITYHLMRGIKGRLLNNGDDCVFICEAKDEARAVVQLRGWSDFGFKCIAEETVYHLEGIEFCQMRPVFDGNCYVMVRNPHVSLSKDTYSICPWYNPKAAKKWANAVSLCGEKLTGGIPVLQSYYRALRTGVSSKVSEHIAFDSGFYRLSQRCNRVESEISEAARHSFYLAFNITPDCQVAMEDYYNSLALSWEFDPQGIPDADNLSWKELTK